jgi:hypothetical protein
MVPPEAAMGGKETMYPEYRDKIKAWQKTQPSPAGTPVAAK